MQVEFLDDISDGGKYKQVVSEQLIRLFDFDYLEAIKFKNLLQTIVIEQQNSLDITAQSFIQPINCTLLFSVNNEDRGIVTRDKQNFECKLSIEGYKQMVYLLEPFCESASGYQWLYDLDTPIDLLFSPDGSW